MQSNINITSNKISYESFVKYQRYLDKVVSKDIDLQNCKDRNGLCKAVDENAALFMLQELSKLGDPVAQYYLGVCYYYGIGFIKDKNLAVKFFIFSAANNNPDALNHVGFCLQVGDGIEKNEKLAFECYLKAANWNHCGAYNNLGYLYVNGVGTHKNEQKGYEYTKKAADLGFGLAQVNLGYHYLYGVGTQKNEEEAVKWFHKSAAQGHALGAYALAKCYEDGVSATQDNSITSLVKKARFANQGYQEAKDSLIRYYTDSEEKNMKNESEQMAANAKLIAKKYPGLTFHQQLALQVPSVKGWVLWGQRYLFGGTIPETVLNYLIVSSFSEEKNKQDYALLRTLYLNCETNLAKLSVEVTNYSIESGFINVKPLPKVSFAKMIPKKLHFIWIGGRISEDNLSNIKSFAATNPDYEINIWTDRPMNILKSEAFSDSGKFRFNLRNIRQLYDSMNNKVNAYLLREMHGAYKNLPAASDILRLFVINEGGIYFDTDVRTGGINYFTEYKELKAKPLGDIFTAYGFLLNFWYNASEKTYKIPTHIIAAVNNSMYVEKYKGLLVSNLQKVDPEILWSIKRKFPKKGESRENSKRYALTLETTGPAFIQKNYKKILIEELGTSTVKQFGELQKVGDGLGVTKEGCLSYKHESNLFPIVSCPTAGIINTGLLPKHDASWVCFFGKNKLRACEYEDILDDGKWKDFSLK